MDLKEQLREDLPKVVRRLNTKRGPVEWYLGKEYELRRDGENDVFTICVSDIGTRKRKDGTPIIADIKIRNGGLDGYIISGKKYSPVTDYIHSLSHQHNIPVGCLLSVI